MLIRPFSGACDYLVRYCGGCIVLTWGVLVLCSGIGCWWCGIRVHAEPLLCWLQVCWCYVAGLAVRTVVSECRLNHYWVVVQPALKSAQYSLHNNAPSSRKLLKMDVLTSETCWAVNWHNKSSVIKFVYLYSNIKMMHGPIRIKKRYHVNYTKSCSCRYI